MVQSNSKQDKRNSSQPATARGGSVLDASLVHRAGSAVKASSVGEGWLEGYLVTWGDQNDTDLQGEFFTPRTEFCLDWFTDRPVLYHHGLDGEAGLRKIGVIKSLKTDKIGLWVQAQLDMRDRYAQAVYDMIKTAEFGWSSGSVDHLVQIADSGEIATWPLIEGSITPTPAQPSKTAVRPYRSASLGIGENAGAMNMSLRAFKAILGDDASSRSYLRGLEARVGSSVSRSSRTGRDTYPSHRATKMDRETEEALAYLEEEMIQETKSMGIRRSRRPIARRGYGYRSDDMAIEANEDIRAQAEDLAVQMADEIAADMEEEIKSQLEEEEMTKRMVRALKRKAQRQALRQLTTTDETGATIANQPSINVGGVGDDDYLGETAQENLMPNAKRFRRARRNFRRGYRSEVEELRSAIEEARADNDIAELKQDEQAILMEEVAAQAYRNGLRKGMRRAFRTTDVAGEPDALSISEANNEAGNYDMISADGADLTVNPNVTAVEAKRYARARRNAMLRRQRALRNARSRRSEDALLSDDAYLMDEPLMSDDAYLADEEALMSETEQVKRLRRQRALRKARALRNARARRSARRSQDPFASDDEALMSDTDPFASDDEAVMSEDEKRKAWRSGYRSALRRNARRRASRRFKQDDNPFASSEEAMMAEDNPFASENPFASDVPPTMSEDAIMEDNPFASTDEFGSKRFRRGARKSMTNSAEYWRNQARKYANMEAPGQRRFGSIKAVTDEADREGSYSNAFKSYLHRGLGMMSDNEKYVLRAKGQRDWSDASGSFTRSGGAYKTYYSGTDASVGFGVPADWVNELNKNIMTQTVMAAECRTRTTTSDVLVQPNLRTNDARRAHRATTRWVGEQLSDGSIHRATEDVYSQIRIPIHIMLMSTTASNQALEDVSFSLEEQINEAFSEAVAVMYDELIWSGDGQNKLLGIVSDPDITTSASTGVSSVGGYLPTGSADGIVTADTLKQMLFHLPRHYRQRAKWYMNSNTGLEIATLKDGNGNYLIDQRDESLQQVGVPDRLLGKPIVYNEFADDIADGNFPIILGDLSTAYTIGKRVDFSIRRFDDSQYAELDQVLFLGRARIGGQPTQPAAVKVLKVGVS